MTFGMKFGPAQLIILWTFIGNVFPECTNQDMFNIASVFYVEEDIPIGKEVIFMGRSFDAQWRVSQPTKSFFDAYTTNSTDNKINIVINITSSTDVDNRTPCDGKLTGKIYLSCGNFNKNVSIEIESGNDHTPTLVNNQGINTKIKEDLALNSHIIEFGFRVKDQDCPTQAITYTVTADRSAQVNHRDGTNYFGIFENGTLYLKKPLNYEDIICSIGGTGELYMTVEMTDVDNEKIPAPKTGRYPLTLTVLNVDDEPPKFIDINSECLKQCSTCEQTSYIANVSYDHVGNISTTPTMLAEDIEKADSVILYFIRNVIPEEYMDLFGIDQTSGTVQLVRSFQNFTNEEKVMDFDVQIIVRALSNRTQLETKNVTVILTVIIPPPTTTEEQTTTEMLTTTEEITTTEKQTTEAMTTPELIETTTTTITDVGKIGGNDLELIVIIVPIAVAVLLVFIILLICIRRSAITATRHKYVMDPKSQVIQTNTVKVEKVEVR